jgi:hypothetical protein
MSDMNNIDWIGWIRLDWIGFDFTYTQIIKTIIIAGRGWHPSPGLFSSPVSLG